MTADDRPPVTDDARAEAMARELLIQTLTANPDEAASASSWEWARRIVGRLLAAGRAETRCMCDCGDSAPPEGNTSDIHRADCPAAARAETTTEDAARVLIDHPSIPDYANRHRYYCPKCPDALVYGPNSPDHALHQAQALASAGLLARPILALLEVGGDDRTRLQSKEQK